MRDPDPAADARDGRRHDGDAGARLVEQIDRIVVHTCAYLRGGAAPALY